MISEFFERIFFSKAREVGEEGCLGRGDSMVWLSKVGGLRILVG